MPIAAAAVSSSRIAIQARPRREYWSRDEQKIVKITSTIANQKYTSVDSTTCPSTFAEQHAVKFAGRNPPVAFEMPCPKPGESNGVMPLGPFVRLNPPR